jgi:organic hydroperoxide reductase OsmC/OhrA
MARLSRMDFECLDSRAEGVVDTDAGVTRFTEIVLHARLRVAPGADRGRAQQLLEKTAKKCLVSASLSTPIRLDTEVLESDRVQPSELLPGVAA